MACRIVGLEAVTLALNFVAEVAEVMDTSEKAEPLPLSRASLQLELDTFMTVFMAALLLLKSHTSITESSSPLVGVVRVAADKSSPLKGADLGLSKTGSLLLFFFNAASGLGPKI